jgi:hypothetical protein
LSFSLRVSTLNMTKPQVEKNGNIKPIIGRIQ